MNKEFNENYRKKTEILRVSVIAIFCGVILIPMMLTVYFFSSGNRIDAVLHGYQDVIEKPELSSDSWMEGEFQEGYAAWLDSLFCPRAFLTKLYNQISYSCFKLAPGNLVVGKENILFEQTYIDDINMNGEYDFSNPDNYESMVEFVDDLEEAGRKLRELGKYLVVVSAPSKAVEFEDMIPASYRIKDANKTGVRAVDVFEDLIKGRDITYLDCNDVLKEHKYPIFYKTGTHWSTSAEQEMYDALIRLLADMSGKELRGLNLRNISYKNTPPYREIDIWRLMNVFESYSVDKFWYYADTYESPQHYDNMRILIQGDSFAEGTSMFSYISDDIYVGFYNHLLSGINDGGSVLYVNQDWNSVNLADYLNLVDFVVVEMDDALFHLESSGFVSALNNCLDEYVPEIPDGGVFRDLMIA